jgi:fructose-bisphosphate aldolase (EC 4.1.2.13)
MSTNHNIHAGRRYSPGVLIGELVGDLYQLAKQKEFAIPGANVIGTNSINACLETAVAVNSPIMIQFSNSGAHFLAGKSLSNTDQKAAIVGAVAGAKYVHEVAEVYGAVVLLHTDHCSKEQLPWLDGLLEVNEDYFAKHGKPLFSSHMLDLSTEPLWDNLNLCKQYLARMAKINVFLEIELGVTGGEEDGVDNTGVAKSRLYTQPEEVALAYAELSKISPNFTIAAAFGNVHGVYKPGNVKLEPKILAKSQELIQQQWSTGPKPVSFVFHGGSGSSREEIREAISYGVVKMNIDTDLQWAFWEGVKNFYETKKDYLQGQIGNPEGADKPNKHYYDPRVWLRKAEENFKTRLIAACEDLNNLNTLALV